MYAPDVSPAEKQRFDSEVERMREGLRSGVVVLGTVQAGKPRFVVGITRDLAPSRLNAGKLLNEVARIAGGGGGGRPDFATGGGGDPSRIGAALEHAFAAVKSALEGA